MSKNFCEIFEELSVLNEMALSRRDAMNRAMDLQLRFIEHFDKIYNDIDNIAINHWASEMQAWLNQVLAIKLSYNNKSLTKEQLRDWFFYGGSESSTLFRNNMTEGQVYDDFVELILENSDVKLSLKKLDLI